MLTRTVFGRLPLCSASANRSRLINNLQIHWAFCCETYQIHCVWTAWLVAIRRLCWACWIWPCHSWRYVREIMTGGNHHLIFVEDGGNLDLKKLMLKTGHFFCICFQTKLFLWNEELNNYSFVPKHIFFWNIQPQSFSSDTKQFFQETTGIGLFMRQNIELSFSLLLASFRPANTFTTRLPHYPLGAVG